MKFSQKLSVKSFFCYSSSIVSDKKPAKKSIKTNGLERSPALYNPLTAYLREIREFPRLNIEEERKLALKYIEQNDLNAAYQLVSANLWLVVKIARTYEKMAKNLMDLIQEGNIGLMEAVKKFDPHKGVRLPSYAVWWIKAYIIRYILANWRLVKIGTTQAQKKLFFNLNKEKRRLETEGFKPTPKLIAQNLNVKESEVIEMEKRLSAPDISVDAPIHSQSEDSLSMHSILPSDMPDSETILAKKQLEELLSKALTDFQKTLKDKQKIIFQERLLSDDKKTLQELADKLDISIERVRQIENTLKEKFSEFVKDNYGALVE